MIGLSLPTIYPWPMDEKYLLQSVSNSEYIPIREIESNNFNTKYEIIKMFVSFFWSFTASIFTGVFIIAASYAECDKLYVVAFFTISIAFQGVPGVAINSLDLSPNYAGILMGVGSAVTSITGILVPYMVGVVTPNVS